MLAEQAGHMVVTLFQRQRKGCLPVVHPCVRVAAVTDQELHHLRIVVRRCLMEG